MPHLRETHEDLEGAARGADLLVSHPLTVTFPFIAQKRGLPWAAAVLAPLSFMSMEDPPLIAGAPFLRQARALGPGAYGLLFSLVRLAAWRWEAPLRRFRQELGLPPTRQIAMFEGQFSPHLNLGLFDPPLAPPQPDWPPNTKITGAPLYDGRAPVAKLIAELEAFLAAGEAPIVFALGSSAVWVAGDFWDKAVAAVRLLKRRAILVTGPATPENLPEGVRAFAYLPYSRLFPRSAVLVHQAGIGTLAQALRAGRPQLIVPFAFDQPDNARRAAQLGVARTLPLKKVTAQALAAELAVLLEQSPYAQKAAAIARELAGIDGAKRAADALLALGDR
jgi:UDP:flavonoid glycosyltransferase YjiC (YdhE family)